MDLEWGLTQNRVSPLESGGVSMRSKLLVLLMVTVCGCLLVGCSSETAYVEETASPVKKESNIMYGDIVYSLLGTDKLIPAKSGESYSNIIRTYDAAISVFPDLSLSESVTSVYDETYFSSHDLLIIAVAASPDYQYTIARMLESNGVLTVNLDKGIPKVSRLLGVYRAILMDIPKGELLEDTEVRLEITEVLMND